MLCAVSRIGCRRRLDGAQIVAWMERSAIQVTPPQSPRKVWGTQARVPSTPAPIAVTSPGP